MVDQIPIHVCSYFRSEVEQFIRDKGLSSQFRAQIFPSLCQGMSASDPVPGTFLFAGNQCPAHPKRIPNGGQTAAVPHNGGIISGACLSLIAPEWLLENLVREGAYVVSPGWLADWKKNLAAWGFDAPGLREFAQDSMKQVCLLDTLSLSGSEAQLAEFAESLGLPASRIPIGMAYCSAVLQEVIDSTPAKPKPVADYAMALDLISQLGQFQHEDQVIGQLLEILSMLFAPGSLSLVRYENGEPAGVRKVFADEVALDEATALSSSSFRRCKTPSDHENGFVLPIDFDDQRLALIFMTELAMPGSRDSYRNLLESIVPVFSLSLNNARNYEALVRNEKTLQEKQQELLATLEFRDRLLAIIGHDLRGPIGSMGELLQVLGESLEGLIPEREMHFLSEIILAAQSASSLLLNLLEWAKLQTAALVLTPELLSARDEATAIFSIMQSQAKIKGIILNNEVDPAVTVFADPNVMQTILRNLVSNALKYTHPGGTVTIRTRQDNGSYSMEIVDSGIGMDTDTLARA
jgi:signal transduction histidine kinase